MTTEAPYAGQRVKLFPACYLPAMLPAPRPIGGHIVAVFDGGIVNVRDDCMDWHYGVRIVPGDQDASAGNTCVIAEVTEWAAYGESPLRVGWFERKTDEGAILRHWFDGRFWRYGAMGVVHLNQNLPWRGLAEPAQLKA